MQATLAFGGEFPFYMTIMSADGLLDLDDSFRLVPVSRSYKEMSEKSKKTFSITVLSSTTEDASMKRNVELTINGEALAVTAIDGSITEMRRNGKPIELNPPDPKLEGNADWIALSRRYHSEALKQLPFTRFLGIGDQIRTNEISVIAQHMRPSGAWFVCGASGKMRSFDYYDNSTRIERLIERQSHTPMPFIGFDDVEKLAGAWPKTEWHETFHARFDKTSGCLISFSSWKGSFSADFFTNGGLETLRLYDPATREGLSERSWSEKGELVFERDLKKDPYPDFDLRNVRILKGGREI